MNAGKETTLSFHSLDKGDYYVVTMRAASEGREFDSEIRLWSNTVHAISQSLFFG